MFDVAELARRLVNLIRLGTIEQADYQAARVRVRSGDLLTGWIPWLTTRASSDRAWWAPELGEQVILLSPSGDPAQAVALPAIYQTAHPASESRETIASVTFEDGTKISYDRQAHKLLMNVAGDMEIVCSGNFKVTASRVDLN